MSKQPVKSIFKKKRYKELDAMSLIELKTYLNEVGKQEPRSKFDAHIENLLFLIDSKTPMTKEMVRYYREMDRISHG